MKKFLFSVLSLMALSATAQETVKLTAGKINDFGLVYNLPTTVAEISLNITKTVTKAGPYYKYAQKYLGVQDVISKNETIYNIDNIEIKEKGIADPEYSYLVKFKSGTTPSMYLSKEGSLISVNIEPTKTESIVSSSSGTKLADNYIDESGTGTYYVQYAYGWGYVDNHPNNDARSNFKIEIGRAHV